MDFKLVEKALTEYGAVVESNRILINPTGNNGKACRVETERFRVAMKLKKDIPTTITVDGVGLRVYYVGQPPTCIKCRKPGHMVKDCPKKKRGWEADETEETTSNNNQVKSNPAQALLEQESEGEADAQNPENEPRNPPEAPPQKDQPNPKGKSQQQREQLKADRRLARKLQQEYNQQTAEQNRPLPEIQITEPFEKAGEQQEQVQAEGTEPETSTSGITASIESVTEEMEVTATSDNIKKTTKRSRTLPQKSTKEFSDYERNNKKKQRGQLSESSMEEEESDNDEDILPQSPENQGPVTQLAEEPSSNTMADLSPTSQGVEEPIDNTQRVNFASADSEQTYGVMVNALNQEKGLLFPQMKVKQQAQRCLQSRNYKLHL
jgi:hypothetical protein